MFPFRFCRVLLAFVGIPACLALILLLVVSGVVSSMTVPIGGASLSSTQNQAAGQGITMRTMNATQPSDQNGPCDWVINIFGEHHIDICLPLRLIVQAGAWAVRGIYHAVAKQVDFLWSTPLTPFEDNSQGGLISVWWISWGIVLTCVTSVLSWAALRYAVGSVLSWLAYANLIELVPRLLFALLAAFYSREFFIMLIQINNALAGIFNTNALTIIMDQSTTGIINSLMQILYGILAFILILEGAARIAVIYLLFAFAPILFFLASLRETQHFAKTAATAAILFIFLQTMQAGALDVGGRVMTSVLHSKPGDLTFLNLLVSVAIMYVTLTLFFGVTRMALGRGGDTLAYAPFAAALGIGRSWRGTARNVGSAVEVARSYLQPLPHPLSPRNPRATILGTKNGLPPGFPPIHGSGPGGPSSTPGSGGPGPTGGQQPGSGSGSAGASPLGVSTPPSLGSAGGAKDAGSLGSSAAPGNWQKTPLARPAGKGLSPSPASQMSKSYANMPPQKPAGRVPRPLGVPAQYVPGWPHHHQH